MFLTLLAKPTGSFFSDLLVLFDAAFAALKKIESKIFP